MSLSVNDPRSRGRSKSPGRERSRSRDYRASSPPEIRPKKSSKESSRKSSSKYYSDDESVSETRTRKSSKKYYDDDSDSRTRSKGSKKYYDDDSDSRARSKKYYEDDSDSHARRKSSKKYYEDRSDSDHRDKKSSSKKYYDDREERSNGESDSDRRRSSHRSAKPKYETAEPRYRRGSSPDSHSTALTRKPEYVQITNPQFEHDRYNGRHPSYATPERYEHGKPSDYTRNITYASEKAEVRSPGTSIPGQYKWEYDHPPASASASEQNRHVSLNTSANFNVGVGGGYTPPVPHYGHPAAPALPSQYPQSPQRPDNQRNYSGSGASAERYAYADPPQHITYTSKTDSRKPSYTQSAQPQFVEVKPNPSALHTSPTEGLGSKLHRLSVSGGAAGALSLAAPGHNHAHMQGGLPPGSPLLEAYRGTYQSISPMPSPLILPSTMDEGLSDLDPLSPQYSSEGSYSGSNPKKRVKFYNPEPDALALAAALKHSHPDSEPIIQVLPRLSDDNVWELRNEYKKHIKVNGKGINVAKHIKMKVPGNLGKIAYAVALGRWESEAYWANFWYQSNSSRRELLIESLMGRTNSEIVKIKDAFSDKRYNDSLEKCMQTELKKDKFRNAVLLALEGKRMDETEKLSIERVRKDVQDLYRALTAKEGGETAMINIIVVRSDLHLREVLRVFEGNYRKNFAREMIQKSQNLVVGLPPLIHPFPSLSLCPFPFYLFQ